MLTISPVSVNVNRHNYQKLCFAPKYESTFYLLLHHLELKLERGNVPSTELSFQRNKFTIQPQNKRKKIKNNQQKKNPTTTTTTKKKK